MIPLTYARATTLDEALDAAHDPGTAVLAGGTELLNWLRLGITDADRVVDISRVPGLDRIEPLPGGGLRIGTLVRLNDVAAHPSVARDWPVLRMAIHKSASAQLRNLATIGANLLQKTRCAYFRSEEPVPCNRRVPGSGCAAREGHDDRHALFGWTDDCIATQPSDPAVALAALDAHVVTRTATGGRRIAVTEFHVLPADGVDRDTVLEPGELVEAIELDAPAPCSAYVKVRERESYEYAIVSAAVALRLRDDGVIDSARIALGSVAMRPWRLAEAERRVVGLAPDDDAVTSAIEAALAQARPVAGSAYKLAIARGAARRALMTAAGVRP
ncbi:xanthine dehydrogenase family protein subunit M [Streptomyces spinoverrucosus]|uniref:FAD binding domain-containing protein n=1 Tax=Streptomyces spinoverrucosus TaxID=284043 RepID=UPI0018C3B347|nr:xanthine dehydrogenase family protein subunit M [Streptomyces spinoverrucosus]MBG0850373.1 xanthine dehydrogenase family protein subunit M [Streptomyces spinoverrucosus]